MSKIEKLKQKLQTRPKSLTYAELVLLLNDAGYYLDRITGSHHHFHKDGYPILTIALHGKDCKDIYKIKIKSLLSTQH